MVSLGFVVKGAKKCVCGYGFLRIREPEDTFGVSGFVVKVAAHKVHLYITLCYFGI